MECHVFKHLLDQLLYSLKVGTMLFGILMKL